MSRAERTVVRFALPSTLGPIARELASQLQTHLASALAREPEVVVGATYEQLARELLSGKADAAWAPPFVCARIEAMGVRVLVRGVRQGVSTYRAALLTRANEALTLKDLQGKTAAWTDRDSVGGYLLPMAWLKEQGVDAGKTFAAQNFYATYRHALEAVAEGKADVTSIFASSAKSGQPDSLGIEEVWAGKASEFRVLGFTDEAPNDGVAVSMNAPPQVVLDLEKSLLSLHQTEAGRALLKDCFHADRFELAPRMGYRALYRVALASL